MIPYRLLLKPNGVPCPGPRVIADGDMPGFVSAPGALLWHDRVFVYDGRTEPGPHLYVEVHGEQADPLRAAATAAPAVWIAP